VYEDVPSDPVMQFKSTLIKASDAYYTFRYLGALDRGATFTGSGEDLQPQPAGSPEVGGR
jgi:hypothetical protein